MALIVNPSTAVNPALTDGSIPYVSAGALVDDHANLAWDTVNHRINADVRFAPSGSGAITTETVQAALRRMVFSGQYSTAGNFNTAQAALTDKAGFKEIRLGTGVGDGIVFPSLGSAPFQISASGGIFNGVFDPQYAIAYNYGRAVASEPLLQLTMEGDYYDSVTHWMELNLDWGPAGVADGLRQMAFQVNRSTGIGSWAFAGTTMRLETAMNAGEFVFTTTTGNLHRQVADGTSSTPINAILLQNTSGGSSTNAAPSIIWDVAGGGGRCSIFSTRLGTAGGVMHIATETTGGVMTDRIVISELGQLKGNDGTKDNPTFTFSSDTNTGIFWRAADIFMVAAGGNEVLQLNSSGAFQIGGSAATIGLSGNTLNAAAADVILTHEAANTLGLKNGNSDQLFRSFGMNGGYWERGSASELLTLSTGGATTDTTANLLPADAIIEAVVARVTTTITTATDWKLGDATISGRFAAANATMTAGATSVGTVHADQTGTSGPRQTAAAKVRVTTTGTPGAGVIRIVVFYRKFIAPTS